MTDRAQASPLFLGIDHLVIATLDPDQAAVDLEREVGLVATGGGRHESMGTHNRIIWLGDSYLELIGVFDPALAEASWIGPATLASLGTGGGLVAWAIATEALDLDLARLHAIGSDLGEPLAGERRRADEAVARWRLAAPPALGMTEPPFLIEHDPTSSEWTRAERTERAAASHPIGGPVSLEALELPVDDVSRTVLRLIRTAGLRFRPSLAGGGARDADIGPHVIRLRPRHDGPATPVVRLAASVTVGRDAELLGCRWVVRATG